MRQLLFTTNGWMLMVPLWLGRFLQPESPETLNHYWISGRESL